MQQPNFLVIQAERIMEALELYREEKEKQQQHYLECKQTGKQVQNEPRHEKTAFCICENKDADQLRGNRKADQRLCFRYIDSTSPLLPKYKISSL